MRWLAAVLALSACSSPDGEAPAVDSTLVAVLTEVQLADARASLDTLEASSADSLRRVALEAHGWDDSDLEDALDGLAADPDRVKATYNAVDVRLGLERQGVVPNAAADSTSRP